jgi:hypothetical protein
LPVKTVRTVIAVVWFIRAMVETVPTGVLVVLGSTVQKIKTDILEGHLVVAEEEDEHRMIMAVRTPVETELMGKS